MTTSVNENLTVEENVANMLQDGMNLGKIEGYLRFVHDKSTNEAKQIVAEVREQLGMEVGGVTSADWSETVEYLREKYGKLDKKDLINGMCQVNGKTYNTNQHAYNYIAMAQEWAKQAVEDGYVSQAADQDEAAADNLAS